MSTSKFFSFSSIKTSKITLREHTARSRQPINVVDMAYKPQTEYRAFVQNAVRPFQKASTNAYSIAAKVEAKAQTVIERRKNRKYRKARYVSVEECPEERFVERPGSATIVLDYMPQVVSIDNVIVIDRVVPTTNACRDMVLAPRFSADYVRKLLILAVSQIKTDTLESEKKSEKITTLEDDYWDLEESYDSLRSSSESLQEDIENPRVELGLKDELISACQDNIGVLLEAKDVLQASLDNAIAQESESFSNLQQRFDNGVRMYNEYREGAEYDAFLQDSRYDDLKQKAIQLARDYITVYGQQQESASLLETWQTYADEKVAEAAAADVKLEEFKEQMRAQDDVLEATRAECGQWRKCALALEKKLQKEKAASSGFEEKYKAQLRENDLQRAGYEKLMGDLESAFEKEIKAKSDTLEVTLADITTPDAQMVTAQQTQNEEAEVSESVVAEDASEEEAAIANEQFFAAASEEIQDGEATPQVAPGKDFHDFTNAPANTTNAIAPAASPAPTILNATTFSFTGASNPDALLPSDKFTLAPQDHLTFNFSFAAPHTPNNPFIPAATPMSSSEITGGGKVALNWASTTSTSNPEGTGTVEFDFTAPTTQDDTSDTADASMSSSTDEDSSYIVDNHERHEEVQAVNDSESAEKIDGHIDCEVVETLEMSDEETLVHSSESEVDEKFGDSEQESLVVSSKPEMGEHTRKPRKIKPVPVKKVAGMRRKMRTRKARA